METVLVLLVIRIELVLIETVMVLLVIIRIVLVLLVTVMVSIGNWSPSIGGLLKLVNTNGMCPKHTL